MQLGFIVSLLFAILITVFAIQNSETVNINFLFANVPVSQALVIFISAAIGAIIVGVLGFFRYFKLNRKIKEQNLEINKLKEDKEKKSAGIKTEVSELHKGKVEEIKIDQEENRKDTEEIIEKNDQ